MGKEEYRNRSSNWGKCTNLLLIYFFCRIHFLFLPVCVFWGPEFMFSGFSSKHFNQSLEPTPHCCFHCLVSPCLRVLLLFSGNVILSDIEVIQILAQFILFIFSVDGWVLFPFLWLQLKSLNSPILSSFKGLTCNRC